MKRDQTYWNQLLEQYYNGSISDEDRYLLEKRALDDPFLIDALEGYQTVSGNHKTNIDFIKKTLIKPEKKQRKKLLIYPIAASLLILFGAVFFINKELKSVSKEDVYADHIDSANDEFNQKEFTESLTTPASDLSLIETLEEKTFVTENSSPKIEPALEKSTTLYRKKDESYGVSTPVAQKQVAAEPKQRNSEPVVIEQLTEVAPSAILEEVQVPITPSKKPTDITYAETKTTVADADIEMDKEEPRTSLKSNRQKKTVQLQAQQNPTEEILQEDEFAFNNADDGILIRGTVLDELDNPLIGATVFHEGTANGTSTNLDGKFTLLPDNREGRLVVSYVGYDSKYFPLSNDSMVIRLSEATVLAEEIVISSLGPPEYLEATLAGSDRTITAKPEMGLSEFNEYIDIYKRVPEEVRVQGLRGEVIVLFTLGENGYASSFKIIESLCEACDAEAIRLIKSSGRWITYPSETKCEVEFSIKF